MKAEVRKPNFIVAGFPKCGTTSLYHYFEDHPEIFLPVVKEVHYFSHRILTKMESGKGDKEDNSYHIKSRDEYAELFKSSNHQLVGEVSPSYISYPEIIKDIKAEIGLPKIIVLVRDPIERAYSNYLHLVREGRETNSFEVALELEDQRFKNGYGDFWRIKFNSMYYEKIEAYSKHFNIKVVSLEEMKHNPSDVIKDVLAFIGASPDSFETDFGIKYNEGGYFQNSILSRFLLKRNPVKDAIKSLIPVNLGKMKRNVLGQLRSEKPQISSATVEELQEYFLEDVKKLSEKYKLDVSKWKNFSAIL